MTTMVPGQDVRELEMEGGGNSKYLEGVGGGGIPSVLFTFIAAKLASLSTSLT